MSWFEDHFYVRSLNTHLLLVLVSAILVKKMSITKQAASRGSLFLIEGVAFLDIVYFVMYRHSLMSLHHSFHEQSGFL